MCSRLILVAVKPINPIASSDTLVMINPAPIIPKNIAVIAFIYFAPFTYLINACAVLSL